MKSIKVMRVRANALLPERKTSGSAGFDIPACLNAPVELAPGETRMLGSGFAVAIEPGYAGFIYARSGLGIKHGIVPANCVGVIDCDYRGEVIVGLRNNGDVPFTVNDGDRIAQMIIAKCETPEIILCDDLDDTVRADGGFGSTGL
jgi:dUTP pyrophosphatase